MAPALGIEPRPQASKAYYGTSRTPDQIFNEIALIHRAQTTAD